jgi:Nucleotidyl transferase AbiEii toxin, Type IV TA system
MPLDELHRQVAVIALRAAAGYGFALGGGNALIQHGMISRPTQDVDLFTDHETGVPAAAGAVEAALREAGFQAERQDETAGLAEIFPDIGEGLAEWIITAPDGEQMALQMAYFDRTREPVITEVGPVLDLEDVIGGKVCALASRAYERDYLDTAAALERYSPAELIGFARRLDPGLEGQDFAEAGQQLDQMPDYAFTSFGLSGQDVARLRERFAAWPREPEAVAADIADDASRHLAQGPAREESAHAAAEAAAGQPVGLPDVRQAGLEEPEIEP